MKNTRSVTPSTARPITPSTTVSSLNPTSTSPSSSSTMARIPSTTKRGPNAAMTSPKYTRPTACYLCSGPPFVCDSLYSAHQCRDTSQQFCITTVHNNDDGTRSLFRSCANEAQCIQEWTNTSAKNSVCANFDPSHLYLDNFQCSYCCNTKLCNDKTVPHNLYQSP